MPPLSVIIPTLNEVRALDATLAALAGNAVPHEVLVVDGGSTDGTCALAEQRRVRVLTSPEAGRGPQMNAGRAAARGEILLFLHADTLPAPTALAAILHAMAKNGVVGGGFARRYASSSRFLRLTCLLAEWRCRSLGWFLGDQGIFVSATAFDALGGFRDLVPFEDLDFSRRLKSRGRLVTLRPPVVSLPRRFVPRGPLRTTLSDLGLTLRFLCGSGANPSGGAMSDENPRFPHPLPKAVSGCGPATSQRASAPRA